MDSTLFIASNSFLLAGLILKLHFQWYASAISQLVEFQNISDFTAHTV